MGTYDDRLFPKVVTDSTLKKFNAYILCPHSTQNVWYRNMETGIDNLATLLDYIVEDLGNVDTNNIVLAGHSGGAVGSTYMAANMDKLPYEFSKLVLMSGSGLSFSYEKDINIPTRGYYGASDGKYNIYYMTGRYNDIPNSEPAISIPNTNHGGVPKRAFNIDSDNDNCSDLIEWLFDTYANNIEEESKGWKFSEDKKVLTKTYTENTEENVAVYDLSGNKSSHVQISVQNIDKIAPQIDISYSTEEKTNGDVVVTITANEEIGNVVSGDNLFDENITYTSKYYEAANGIMPYALITPSTATSNSSSIPLIVWLHGDGEIGVNGTTFMGTYDERLFPRVVNDSELLKFNAYILCPHSKTSKWWQNLENGINNLGTLLEYIVEDLGNVDTNNIVLVGHSGGAVGSTYMAANMDKLPYKFSKLVLMSGADVGYSYESDINIPTRGYYGAIEDNYYISYMKGKYTNIPNSEPAISISNTTHAYVPKNAFNLDTDSNNCSDLIEWLFGNYTGSNKESTGWNFSEDKKVITKTYTENTEENIAAYDLAGNKSNYVQVSIQNINKIAPQIDINYSTLEKTNKDVVVTITSNQEIQGITTTANDGKQEIVEKFSFTVHEEDYRNDSEYIKENMPYIWCSSPDVEEKDSVPLIVFLHGLGEFSTTKDVLRNSSYIETFENWSLNGFHGYIMFPHGITACFDVASSSGWANSGIQMRLRNIIDNFIQERGNINVNKIILVGHSTGGVGALNVANTFPDDFDKLVAISAVYSEDTTKIKMPTLCICRFKR